MNIANLGSMDVEAVNYIISAKDVSAAAIQSATAGVRKLESDTKTHTDRMASHWTSYQKHFLAVTAGIATATVAMMKAWDMAKIGAGFEEQRGILDNLARKYSMTADSIVADMERASEGLIARSNLMQVALGGIAKGLKPDQLISLAGAANILGDAVGKNATEALTNLTEALETGRARGLKTYLGTALDLKAAFGDLEGKMTDTEKAQAMYNLTMITAARLQAQQKKDVDGTADAMEKFGAQLDNAKLLISRSAALIMSNMLPALTLWAEGLDSLAKSWNAFLQPTGTDILKKQEEVIRAQIKAIEDWQRTPLRDMSGEAEKQLNALQQQLTIVRQSIKNDEAGVYGSGGTPAVDPKIAAYQAQIDALKKLLQGREDAKKSVKDLADAEKWMFEQNLRNATEETQAREKEWADEATGLKAAMDAKNKAFDDEIKYRQDKAMEWAAWDTARREKEGQAMVADMEADRKERERLAAEKVKMEKAAIFEIERYRREAFSAQYNDMWTQIMTMANQIGGELGVGIGMMGAGMKGISDIQAGQDKYSLQIEAANALYRKLEQDYAGHEDAMGVLTMAGAERNLAIEQATANQRVSIYQNMTGAMAGAMYALYAATGQQSEAMFRIYQAVAIAETVISTYKAAQDAYAWGMKYGGPFAPYLAVAMAAVATAAGMARVAAIASQNIGGGAATAAAPSGGGGYAYSQPTESAWQKTEPAKAAPIINIHILGNVVDQGQFVRDIIPEIRKAYSDNVH